MTRYKALVFDLGKVVFDFSFDRTFVFWAKATGKTFEEVKDRFVFDETFYAFERGDISPTEFRTRSCQMLGVSLPDEVFDAGWCDLYLELFPGSLSLLQKLKNDYRLVALTNTNAIHATVWKNMYEEIPSLFERVFSSHEIHARKPEPKAFNHVLNYLDIPANGTIFLDDIRENVDAAAALGMGTIQVTSPAQMIRDLEKKLDTTLI
jgi:epoxide hydrolase-like predicted phosphatase